jgi:hypothetical protein
LALLSEGEMTPFSQIFLVLESESQPEEVLDGFDLVITNLKAINNLESSQFRIAYFDFGQI